MRKKKRIIAMLLLTSCFCSLFSFDTYAEELCNATEGEQIIDEQNEFSNKDDFKGELNLTEEDFSVDSEENINTKIEEQSESEPIKEQIEGKGEEKDSVEREEDLSLLGKPVQENSVNKVETKNNELGMSLYPGMTTTGNLYASVNSSAESWFNLPEGGAIIIPISFNCSKAFSKNSYVNVYIYSESTGKKVVSEKVDLSRYAGNKELPFRDNWWIGTDYTLTPGNYKIGISNSAGGNVAFSYSMRVYVEAAKTLTIPQSISVKAGTEKELPLYGFSPSGSCPYLVDISSSNEAVAAGYFNTSKNKYMIWAEKPGSCTLNFKTENGNIYRTVVKVTNGTPELEYTSIELYKGETQKNNVLYTNKKVKWKSSNKKIATVSKNGKIKAKRVGKCTITATVGGKKLKCKIKVIYREPNFGAYLYDYDTRSNTFVIKLQNKGSRSVTIVSGSKVEDVDYKSFDRKIYLKKRVTIKPGKTKYIRFKVKGRTTWHDFSDFTLRYKFKYDGKTYSASTWDEDSVYKRGKSWYSTYWNEEWYSDWNEYY